MANPYALDFNPLASAISDNQQLDLARNRLAMDQERLGMEQTRLGFERELQPIRVQGAKLTNQQAEQAVKSGRLEYENAVGKTFGGVAQNISERLAKNPNDAAAIADWNMWANHPHYKDYFASNGIPVNDPLRGSQAVLMRVRGFQDPIVAEAKRAEIDKDKAQAGLFTSQAAASRFVPLPKDSRGAIDSKTGRIVGADDTDRRQQAFDESWAKEHAPKEMADASAKYATANETHETLQAMAELAPHAATGFQGPIPPEIALKARKIAASMGLPGADKIAPTELFYFLSQKGVFDVLSKMKPATDLDRMAAERASISIQTDPATFPMAMPVMLRVQQRTMAIENARMEAASRGRPADMRAIMVDVNQRLPILNMQGQAGQVDGAAAGPRVAKPTTDRLPQTGQAQPEAPLQAQGWTPQDLASARPGQKTPNGKFIFGRDGKLHPVTGDVGTERNPHEIGLFSGPTLKDGEYAVWNGKLYQQRGTGFGSLVPVERQ